MLSDIDIAQRGLVTSDPIQNLLLDKKIYHYSLYGSYKAKVPYDAFGHKNGKLILVTAVNPTPLGEGKTTMSIGLADGLNYIGEDAVLCLREPSLGPVFGIKGGAAGGGYSQVIPMEDINLHFTGDLHAIESANNLLAAMIDNHIFQGNELDIQKVTWRRCMDMNDRQLRKIECGLGGKFNGVPREDGFDITVASEVMAIFCLATSLEDLKERLGNIIIGYNSAEEPVYARDLNANGAMTALLRDAFDPNVVQTLEHTMAFIHGGPFANIAHGCNSIVATKLALTHADYVVTEAGFGADLGAEKFLDIKCRVGGLKPDAIVLVATTKALKYNGGVPKEDVTKPNMEALKIGVQNLQRHILNLISYNVPVVVCINRYHTDIQEELDFIREQSYAVPCVTCSSYAEGAPGAAELATAVKYACMRKSGNMNHPYDIEDPDIKNKVFGIANKIYGATSVEYSPEAEQMLEKIAQMGYNKLPVCIAKTQYSFSDDPKLLNAPTNFTIKVNEVRLSAGARFIVCICGKMMTMPGLPKVPAANNISVNENHSITGLF